LIKEYEDKISDLTSKHGNTLKILKKLNNKYNVIEKIVQEKSRDESTLINELSIIKKSIDLFEKDQCPTCGNDFHGADYDHTRKTLNTDATTKKSDLITIREELKSASENLSKCTKFVRESKDSITRLETLIGQYEFELNNTISKSENKDFQYLKQLINENTSSTKSKNDLKHKREINEKFLEVVENILGEDGVKNLALKTILPPLNASIDSMVKQMHIPHRIKFDEKFNCKITSLGEEINPNTMSTGERKKSDFIIIIAMIKLLKVRYPSVNMLFLDEIFSSIDGAGIHEIIGILKDTVQETGLNTWVINHSELPVNLFDIKAEAYKEGGFSKLSLESII
jgi:predicted  nucleic acid-binding Zn-ribbon protein